MQVTSTDDNLLNRTLDSFTITESTLHDDLHRSLHGDFWSLFSNNRQPSQHDDVQSGNLRLHVRLTNGLTINPNLGDVANFQRGDEDVEVRQLPIQRRQVLPDWDTIVRENTQKLTSEQYMQFLKQIEPKSDEHKKIIQEMIDCALCCAKLCDDAGLEFDETVKNEFDPKSVSKTTCNHSFHTRCIVHYFKHQSNFQVCPMCRKPVGTNETAQNE